MRNYKGFRQVFDFTYRQRWQSRGYRVATILLAVVLFLTPVISMVLVEKLSAIGDGAATDAAPELAVGNIETVFVVDEGAEEAAYAQLNNLGVEGFTEITYTLCTSYEEAVQAAASSVGSLILCVDQNETGRTLSVLLPENTELAETDAEGFKSFLEAAYSTVLLATSGIDPAILPEAMAPVQSVVTSDTAEDAETEETDPLDSVRTVLSFVLPYLNIMVLYFLVLFYGQGVANNVIMEKTSKLMDTFLVSVKPGAMVFGKVLAIVLASITQFMIWICALLGGFWAGTALVRMMNPETDMLLIRFFETIGQWGGAFSVPGVILGILLVFAGFLLYCGLAAIGGAVASKPEDLASTNVLFTLVLVASFFATLFSGAMEGSLSEGVTWLDLVPFTAVLVTPSRVLLGDVSLLTGVCSLALVLVVSGLFMALAGKVYRMMSLYRGNVPKPAQLLAMLRGK